MSSKYYQEQNKQGQWQIINRETKEVKFTKSTDGPYSGYVIGKDGKEPTKAEKKPKGEKTEKAKTEKVKASTAVKDKPKSKASTELVESENQNWKSITLKGEKVNLTSKEFIAIFTVEDEVHLVGEVEGMTPSNLKLAKAALKKATELVDKQIKDSIKSSIGKKAKPVEENKGKSLKDILTSAGEGNIIEESKPGESATPAEKDTNDSPATAEDSSSDKKDEPTTDTTDSADVPDPTSEVAVPAVGTENKGS